MAFVMTGHVPKFFKISDFRYSFVMFTTWFVPSAHRQGCFCPLWIAEVVLCFFPGKALQSHCVFFLKKEMMWTPDGDDDDDDDDDGGESELRCCSR